MTTADDFYCSFGVCKLNKQNKHLVYGLLMVDRIIKCNQMRPTRAVWNKLNIIFVFVRISGSQTFYFVYYRIIIIVTIK